MKSNNDDTDTKENTPSTITKIGLAAAAITTGIIAAKVLSDEDNRKKISDGLKSTKEAGKKIINKITDKSQELTSKIKDVEARGVINEFEKLRAKIEAEDGSQFKSKLEEINLQIEKIKNSGEADVKNLISELKNSFEQLKAKYEKNASQVNTNDKSVGAQHHKLN